MIELLSEIKENLEQDNYKNERAVEQQIVFPVLKELGWNINNPSQIEPQYELKWQATEKGKKVEKRRVVDYALLVDKKARVIIEVKAVGNLKEADSQLFEYAFHVGTPLAILTDGHKWRVYYCYGTGNYDERLVRSLDLYDSPHEVMEYLSRYLAFAEVKSKKAEKNARKDLENKTNKESAKKTIPKAWKKIAVDEPDELVDRLIEETAQEASGIAPNKDDVIAFLKNLTSPEITLSPQRVEKPQSTAPHRLTKLQSKATKSSKRPPKKPISYTLSDKTKKAKNLTQAYVEIISIFISQDPNFLKRLAFELSETYLTQNPDFETYRYEELSDGWYLNLRTSSRDKERNLKTACEVAGIKFDKDLKLYFSNA